MKSVNAGKMFLMIYSKLLNNTERFISALISIIFTPLEAGHFEDLFLNTPKFYANKITIWSELLKMIQVEKVLEKFNYLIGTPLPVQYALLMFQLALFAHLTTLSTPNY